MTGDEWDVREKDGTERSDAEGNVHVHVYTREDDSCLLLPRPFVTINP